MHKAFDCLVAGGGPAGSTAAALLASRGRRVALVDRSKQPHHKVCGEFLSYEALRYLADAGVNPWNLGAVPIHRVRLAGSHLIAETALPFQAASISRKTMDTALLNWAKQCGAHLLTGRQVERLSEAGSEWSALLDDGQELHADQAMLATGKHDLRGHARGPGSQSSLVAFKMYLRLSAEQRRNLDETVEIVLFPGGYLGLQPTETQSANLCLLIHQEKLQSIGGGWAGVLRHLVASSGFLRDRLSMAEAVFPYPLAISKIPYGYVCKESPVSLWALGDQAAVIPSFCGDGIAIALHSAHLAASLYTSGRTAAEYCRAMYDCQHRRVAQATAVSRAMIGAPWLASLLRYFPSLIERLALATRIPDNLLLSSPSVDRIQR